MHPAVVLVELAADSMAKASSHEPMGAGPLWKTPGLQLPAYIQHIANDLEKERGMDRSRAIATAVAACKRWAAGGGNVDANTRAAATKALAEWEAAKARAHAVHATTSRPAIQLAASWNEAAHPRVQAGSATGGEFTAGQGGSSSTPPPAKGKAGAKGGKAGAGGKGKVDPAAQALWDKMASMTPAQQAAYLKGLSPAQLQSLGTAAFAPGQAIAPGMVAARTLVSGELSSRGLTIGKPAAAGKAAAKKPAGKKSSSGGGKSSSGGKSSGGGKSGGGSSGGSKPSGSKSSSDAAKAAAAKKAASAKTAAEKKAAAAVAAAARAKAAADKKAAAATTTAEKKAAAAAKKAAADQARAAAAAAKAAAAAAKKKRPTVPAAPSGPYKKPVAAGYEMTDRRLIELASAPDPGAAVKARMASKGMALGDGSFRIPNVSFLRKAIQSYGRCPPEKRDALVNLVRKRARDLGAIQLDWVQNFLKQHTGGSADSASGPPKT